MEKLFVLVLILTLLVFSSETSPILTEKQAKQLLRSRRQDRPSKPGFPDEPIRQLLLLADANPVSASRTPADYTSILSQRRPPWVETWYQLPLMMALVLSSALWVMVSTCLVFLNRGTWDS